MLLLRNACMYVYNLYMCWCVCVPTLFVLIESWNLFVWAKSSVSKGWMFVAAALGSIHGKNRFYSVEALVRRCPVKKVFLNISQDSQESILRWIVAEGEFRNSTVVEGGILVSNKNIVKR